MNRALRNYLDSLLTKRLSDSLPLHIRPESRLLEQQSVIDSTLLSVRYSEQMRFGVKDELNQFYLIRIGRDAIEVLQRLS